MNYYERHLGDYARDTAHLSLLEHGVYTVLLDHLYASESGIPVGSVHRIARARTPEECAAVDSVLADFFRQEAGFYIQTRVQREIERARIRIETARNNGKKGGRPTQKPARTQREPKPSIQLTQSKALQTPDTSLQNKIPPTRRKSTETSLPDDLTLTPELAAYVAEQLPDADAPKLFARFCDQARAKDWRYANWVAAFRVYCRNAKPDSAHFSAGQYPRKSNGGTHTAVMR